MSHKSTVGRGWGVPAWLALVAAAVGLVLIVVALSAQVSAPEPPRSVGRIDESPSAGARPSSSPSPSPQTPSSPKATKSPPLKASRPTSIFIPSVGIRSDVKPIGLAKDGTLAVPAPGPDLDKAAWFKNSPTPGQPGPAIIEGHVDTTSGPSVFFELGKVRPGDKIRVTRADGIVAVFTVNAVRDYKKKQFPTSTVYGAKDLSRSTLRLITCSDFDPTLRTHVGNAVVFAALTKTIPAR